MILIAEDCGSIPLFRGFVGRLPFSQADDVILDLMKLDDNV
jgi:hypothetical protein